MALAARAKHFADFRLWPKTLSGFVLAEVRFAGICE